MKRRQIFRAQASKSQTGSSARRFTNSGPVLPFNPASITGCQLWLDAADTSSILMDSSSNVSLWIDKSGNELSVSASSSQPTYASNALNGLGTLAFNGTQNLSAGSVTAGKLLGNTGGSTTFCVFSVSNNSQSSCPFTWDDSGYTYRFMITLEGSQGLNFDLGDITTTSSSRVNIPTSSVTFANNTYYLVSFWQSSGSAVLNVNGGTYTSTTSSGFTGNMPTSTSRTFNVGSYSNNSSFFMKGNTAEILVFNRSLTTNQRQKVEGYLAHKWDLKSSLPSNHPYKSASPTYEEPVFTPTLISECGLWLDGADSSTITATTSLTGWSDKSGNGRNATVYNGTPTYALASGVTFNGSSSLQVSYPASPTVETLFVIIKFNSVSSQSDIFAGTSTGQREFLMYSPYSPGTLYLGQYGSAPSGSINGGTVTTGTTYMLGYVFNGTGNSISFFQSGNTTTSGTPQFTYGSGGTVSLIGSYGGGGFLQGQIYDVIVFNSSLSTIQRKRVEGYLAQKWGLQSSLPANHPYKTIAPIGIPRSITIQSVSAFFNTGTNTCLTIPANSVLTLGTNNHTIEFWMYQVSRGQYDVPFAYGKMTPQTATTNYYMNSGSQGFGVAIGNGSGGWAVQLTGTIFSLNAWHHYAIVRNGTTFTFYVNGTSIASTTSSISIPAQGDVFRVGSDGEGYGLTNSYISNFRLVNGTAVYTSNFTPPTSPLTAIPNTQILIQGLVDRSPNAFTVTNNGGVALSTSISPFV
jgi:hypothetical protein